MISRAGSIVVGVDHTPGSRAALDFALEEGLARGVPVEVVTAWRWSPTFQESVHADTLEEARAVAVALQDEALVAALARLSDRPVITQVVVHEYAGKELVARAEDARMLVVGSGSKDARARSSLGPVSDYCVRHSSAPVVVIPDPGDLAQSRHVTTVRPAVAGGHRAEVTPPSQRAPGG